MSYPFLVDPTMTTQTQCVVWSTGFRLFTVLSGALYVMVRHTTLNARNSDAKSFGRTAGKPASSQTTSVPLWNPNCSR